jgi:hypothetical protein
MPNNTLLTPSIISKETLVILSNNLVAAGKVNRQFENQFVKIGTTLTIRKPNRYVVSSGPGLQIQNSVEPSTSITVSNQRHVDIEFSSQELTLVIEEFSERYLKPAAEPICNQIDYDVISNWTQVFNEVGTPGTVPSSFATGIMPVGQAMDLQAVPQEGRFMILGPVAYWSLANGLISLFVQSVSEPALKGYLARIGNFEIYQDQNIQTQTVGAYAGTPTVNGAGQTGSSLVTNGWTGTIADLLNPGDVFTIAGVFAVNPQNRQSTGALQKFVVTAQASSSGGAATLSIYPAITTTGAYQTVTNSPANGAAITVLGTASTSYQQNLAFTKDAFGLVTVPMELPDGVDFKARQEYKGISIRIIRAYDVNNDVLPCRLDVLYGTACYYPELAVRLTN